MKFVYEESHKRVKITTLEAGDGFLFYGKPHMVVRYSYPRGDSIICFNLYDLTRESFYSSIEVIPAELELRVKSPVPVIDRSLDSVQQDG